MPAWVTTGASAAVLLGSFGVSQAAATPLITGADGDVWTVTSPIPTYDLTAAAGAISDQISWSLDGGGVTSGSSPLTVKLPGTPDGLHTLSATDTDPLGPAAAQRTFRVDLTAPKITVNRPSSGAQIDLNAQVTADFSCEDAVSCTGTVAPGAAIDTSAAGGATLTVRAIDDVGNETITIVDYVVRAPANPAPGGSGAQPSEPISLVQTPTVSTTARPRAPYRPRTINARAMKPRVGILLPTRRPLLRWGAHKGAQLYNVQIFWLRGSSATKVVSAFTRGHNLRVPAGRVAFGHAYIWRVWPYVRGRYTSRPLGLSYFSVRRQARVRTTGDEERRLLIRQAMGGGVPSALAGSSGSQRAAAGESVAPAKPAGAGCAYA